MSRSAVLIPLAFLALSLAGPVAAQERVEMAGGGGEIFSLGYAATGGGEAGGLVRGCPGFAEAAPAIEIAQAGAGDLFLYLAGEGLAGAVVVRPDGLHACETPNVYGYVGLDFRGGAAGSWLVHPLASAAGASVSGVAIVSGFEVGVRDVVSYAGITVDPAVLPPLITEVPLDPLAEPAFGAVDLPAAGELSLPVTLAGLVPASDASGECAGLIDQKRPDVRLSLREAAPLLAIRAESEADTTLLVRGPDGAIRCVDDAVGFNPALVVESAAAGDYAIWVGVYAGGEGSAATLVLGRTAPEGVAPSATAPAQAGLDAEAAPAWGAYDLPADGETAEIGLVISGGAQAGSFDPSCAGEIDASRPDLTVSVADYGPLRLEARSGAADTTLLVMEPSGLIHCNDDWRGSDAALSIDPAAPGFYAVWVGAFGGGAGAEATLVLSRAALEGGEAGGGAMAPPAPEPSPFLGRDLPNAVAALDILREDPEFAASLSWERLEETGPEGFVLHGVTITEPDGSAEPISIDRIRISELDLAGMSANGSPERFALAFEGIGYASLAAAAQADGVMAPALASPPPLDVSVSVLPPDGDESRRDVRVGLDFQGQFRIGFAARTLWREGAMAMGPEMAAATSETESVEIVIDDMGYLGLLVGQFAAESGAQPADIVAMALAQLEGGLGMMGPFAPESPRGRLLAAVSERLNGLDRPGAIRVRLSAPVALDAETAFAQLMADAPDPSVISVEIAHEAR